MQVVFKKQQIYKRKSIQIVFKAFFSIVLTEKAEMEKG